MTLGNEKNKKIWNPLLRCIDLKFVTHTHLPHFLSLSSHTTLSLSMHDYVLFIYDLLYAVRPFRMNPCTTKK